MQNRKGRKKYMGDSTGFVIMLIMLATILFYIFTAPVDDVEQLLGESLRGQTTVLNVTPGDIPVEESSAGIKRILLPNVLLDNTVKPADELISTQYIVSRSIFRSQPVSFQIDVPNLDDVSKAYVSMLVSNRKGNGELFVTFNGKTVFSRIAGDGETLMVELPASAVKEGANSITLSVSRGGLTGSEYLLSNVRFQTEQFNAPSSRINQGFSLRASEVNYAQSATLTAFAKQMSPQSANMNIELNGESLYRATPGQSLIFDITPSKLNQGPNTLTWSVDPKGMYSLQFVELNINTLTFDGGKDFFFTVTEEEYNKSINGGFECLLTILKTSGSDEIGVQVNSYSNQYSFSDGTVSDDVCHMLKPGRNKIMLSSDEELTIERLLLELHSMSSRLI